MVGTGVFTSLGFQHLDTQSGFVILVLMGWTLWFVFVNRPVEGVFGLGVIVSGLVLYWLLHRSAAASDR